MSILTALVAKIDMIDLAVLAHVADAMPWPILAIFLTVGLIQNLRKKYMHNT
jgi:hypothetical protein